MIAHALVACMPKSGSTFLSEAIASLPGFVRAHLVPGYGRREQELCSEKLSEYRNLNLSYVAQHHVRYSEVTQFYIDQYSLRPIVLVRNIFDIVPSLIDHHSIDSAVYPAAFAPDDIASWSFDQAARFVTFMAIPWYFNFFVSWQRCQNKLIVTYEELVAHPEQVMERICEFIQVPVSTCEIGAALKLANSSGFRKNKIQPGRGANLPVECINHIHGMVSFYPDVDFSPVGL